MPGYREPTPQELESSRDSRVARRQLSNLELSVKYLEQAARLRALANLEDSRDLARLIKDMRSRCLTLHRSCGGRVESRRRPRQLPTADSCTIFLDECGQHMVTAADAFPVFVLAAVIIRDVDWPVVDGEWKRWKHDKLGSEGAIVHEPDVRRKNPPFYGEGGRAAVESLPEILGELDFAALAVVVHRADYLEDFGTGPIDSSLPDHLYLMALDFLMERALFALDSKFPGSKATVVAESRGPKEDALLQYEFARLHLDGTSYISTKWFQQQLHPGIKFLPKTANNTGLQLADLLARPVGDKVARPDEDPPRWASFREKLISGHETKHSVIGLKVVPWRERYNLLWKS